tara:strand:+ start:1294 stop:1494 length:201 start_codon:yes stop_codon:yes gene_type:complete
MVNNMNEEIYRRNVEKMTNSEWIAFVNEKVQEMDILQKILKENTIDAISLSTSANVNFLKRKEMKK